MKPDPTWVLATAGAAAERTAGQVPRETSTPAATITGKGTAAWKVRGTHGRRRDAPSWQRCGECRTSGRPHAPGSDECAEAADAKAATMTERW